MSACNALGVGWRVPGGLDWVALSNEFASLADGLRTRRSTTQLQSDWIGGVGFGGKFDAANIETDWDVKHYWWRDYPTNDL
ncbi:hypothetical protein AGMMS49525_06640 [Bacteroidia bacterium]|nr:hypothetical protein AGMMS49525_06640 [Bacteroidia bacterium]